MFAVGAHYVARSISDFAESVYERVAVWSALDLRDFIVREFAALDKFLYGLWLVDRHLLRTS